MATTFYWIRHGESEANLAGMFLGHGDLRLTETGRKQAAMTASYLLGLGIRPCAIYASDLSRAYTTACTTAEQLGLPITKDPNLREIDAGLWDLVPFAELTERFPESYRVWLENIAHAQCDGGESIEQLRQRILSALEKMAQSHENGVVFVFSHGTPVRIVAATCLDGSLEAIGKLPWPSNASVTKVVYDQGALQLVEYSRDDFMDDLVTKLPDNV